LLLFSAAARAAPESAPHLDIRTDKTSYWRYELVSVRVRPVLDVASGALRSVCGYVRYGGRTVTTVGRDSVFFFQPSAGGTLWQLNWPAPWNPPLGRYTIHVSAEYADGQALVDSVGFYLVGRKPARLKPGYAVLTIEDTNDRIQGPIPHPRNRTTGLVNVVHWADYLGADALWYCVGHTQEGKPGVTDGSPWRPKNLRIYSRLGRQVQAAGLDFGGWIGCYFLWGKRLKNLRYSYNIDYDSKKDRLFEAHRVSLLDRKRRQDIIDLARRLEADPVVDHIGFDYIRGGFGGYEVVNEFVDDMYITVPSNWISLGFRDRVLWLARSLKVTNPAGLRDKWNWWRAHKAASIVNEVIRRAGLTKPVWVFMLGWEMGHEHGQDPLMMIDAGVSWPSVMLYESNAAEVGMMARDWRGYLDPGQTGSLVGQIVDWDLVQKSARPPGPAECYRRLLAAGSVIDGGEPAAGFFWHDLHRILWGRRGPYGSREWAIAGAAAFSRLRLISGRLPVELSVEAENRPDGPLRARVRIANRLDEPIANLRLKWLPTGGLEPVRATSRRLPTVGLGRSLSVDFSFGVSTAAAGSGKPPMVAFELSGSAPDGFRAVAFDYPDSVPPPGPGPEMIGTEEED
jgi:hypothetical protein